jgi:DnaJ like chaperone protein
MLELINGILAIGFDIITIVFRIIIVLVAALTATLKGRNGYFWGIVTLVVPWIIILLFLLPRKIPKFRSYLKEDPAFKERNPVIASIMALSAIVAKADGQVSSEEVGLIRKFVATNFRISSEELNLYQDAFDYGKDHPDEYQEFVRVLRIYHNNRGFILSISYLLLMIGVQGKTLTTNEEVSIKKIVMELGLSEYEFESVKQYFVNGNQGFGNQSRGTNSYGPYGDAYHRSQNQNVFSPESHEDKVKKYSKVLDVNKNSDIHEIKKAYRKLAKEYHPDKVESTSMPDEYKQYAHQRTVELNEAYGFLKEAKRA